MKESKKIILGIRSKKDFFARGKAIAKIADELKSLPNEKIIWFEDVNELEKFKLSKQ